MVAWLKNVIMFGFLSRSVFSWKNREVSQNSSSVGAPGWKLFSKAVFEQTSPVSSVSDEVYQ